MEQRITRKELTIAGMHCHSCEALLEEGLVGLPGVREVEANYVQSRLKVAYDEDVLDFEEIKAVIGQLGYGVKGQGNGDCGQEDGERAEKLSGSQWLGILILALAVYLIVNKSGGFGFLPEISSSMSYGILFAVGLLTSIHCLGMCGGINLSQCATYKIEHINDGKIAALRPSFLYNSGRVISYTLIGGLAGTLGSFITFSGTARGGVAIAAGIFMAIMGLNMLNVFPGLRRFNLRMPKKLGEIVNRNRQRGPFYIGLLNGFMPCGPLQAMQLYALGTGSLIAGALSMLVFSLGTVPLMFGLGAAASWLNARFRQRMLQVSGALVITLGILMFSRGLNLSGIDLAYATASKAAGNMAQIKGNVQVVVTDMEPGRYTPIIVQKGIPVEWTIRASARDLNGCNNPIAIPKYGIEKTLTPGDNVIKFVPQEEGTITYTCWMGMISSTINVVADIDAASPEDIAPGGAAPSSGGCGCCQAKNAP